MPKSSDRDPGDAVPPGVAPEKPPPPGPEEQAAKQQLERLPHERDSKDAPPKT